MTQNYFKPEKIDLKNHPSFNERWVQNMIAEDPSILGLGELELRHKERPQPRAGRLDLLLQDPDTFRRYEVEIQLGSTDEAHIIRTIEYWDIERKRYPQYDHCAVIVAENITSRFLNVLSLFNGSIPLIAIQMQALNVGENLTLVFTTVVDELTRGWVDEDEEAEAATADRPYWEKKAAKATLSMADDLLEELRMLDPSLKLNYTKNYIGLEKNGQAYNFVNLKPRKKHINFEIKIPRAEEVDRMIEQADLHALEYNKRWGLYRISLTEDDIRHKTDILRQLSRKAYDRRAKL